MTQIDKYAMKRCQVIWWSGWRRLELFTGKIWLSVFGKAHGWAVVPWICFCYIYNFFYIYIFPFRYKVSLFSKWKQRGMFATCMWIVQLLLVMSRKDSLFGFVPEYYVDTLVSKLLLVYPQFIANKWALRLKCMTYTLYVMSFWSLLAHKLIFIIVCTWGSIKLSILHSSHC